MHVLSVRLLVCPSACLSVCLLVCASVSLSCCLSPCLSWLSVCLSLVCLLVCLFACLFLPLFVLVSAWLWACLRLFVCLFTISSLLYQTRCCTMLPVLALLTSFRLAALSPCDWLVHCGRPRTCLRFNCHWEHSPTLVALVDVESPYKG